MIHRTAIHRAAILSAGTYPAAALGVIQVTALVAAILASASVATEAQAEAEPAAIRGVVRDPQGAVIANANIEISCGGDRRTVKSSASGEFAQDGLPLGRCRITAASESFEAETTTVDTGADRPVTLVLQVRHFSQEIVVTPTRGDSEERTLSVPESVSVTSRRDITSRPYTLLPQVLQEEPGILVQQTTSAQVSPIIRGFTGQSNVYLLDGVRLNTSSWRSGPSQYSAWVDAGLIESIEIVRGGGSVQYGSDALGGTIQFRSEATPLGARTGRLVGGSVDITGATANGSVGGRADLALQAGRVAVRIGGSRQEVGDLRAGGGLDSHAAVTRFLGVSSQVVDSRQRGTAFAQDGAYAVASANPGSNATLRVLYMRERQQDVNRYDRILGGEGLFRSGFAPQGLDFGIVRYAVPNVAGFDGLSAAVSLNRQADGRFEQARPNARLDQQTGTTTAYGYQTQAHKQFGMGRQLLVGAEFYDETIDASRQLVDPVLGTQQARPDIADGTGYSSVGVFAQQGADLIPNRLTVRGGLRFSGFRFTSVANPTFGVVDERVASSSLTFQAAAVVTLVENLSLTANVTRGFRAANAGDLGNIGLTGGGGFEITPSRGAEMAALVGSTGGIDARSTGERLGGLRPEVVYQYDIGLKGRAGRVSGTVNGFDMELFDFIQRRALVFDTPVVGTSISGFQIVRQDTAGLAYISQDIRPIATRVNVDRARILGFDAEGEVRVNAAWTGSAFFSVANGRAMPSGEFVRRMPPPMGGAKLRWHHDRLWAEGVVSVALEQTRLNSADLSDARIGALRTRASIATFFDGRAADLGLVQAGMLVSTGETLAAVQSRVLGTATSAPLFTSHPGYVVAGLRGGIRLGQRLDLSVIGENLLDRNYRLYGSGLDAPGRNVHARFSYRF
jgi:hemoglobin/transferrin/lactoferrin receptor protein